MSRAMSDAKYAVADITSSPPRRRTMSDESSYTSPREIASLDAPAEDRVWRLLRLLPREAVVRWACDVAERALAAHGGDQPQAAIDTATVDECREVANAAYKTAAAYTARATAYAARVTADDAQVYAYAYYAATQAVAYTDDASTAAERQQQIDSLVALLEGGGNE